MIRQMQRTHKKNKVFRQCILLFNGIYVSVSAMAQHAEMHADSMSGDMSMQEHGLHKNDSASMMTHAYSLELPMTRNASGTGWQPDASVMYGFNRMAHKWMFMFHGNFFLRYNRQDLFGGGERGGEKIDAPNWFMLMGQRRVGERGLFSFVSMISLDPFTVGGGGYPLLFQTGETYQGKRLVDRQHPHDLFSALSVAYTQKLSRKTDVTLYLGYPAEPALGPVAFMHRLSAMNNPDAPLSHHWQDATHISYGVATLSLRLGIAKIEASCFNAKEPNENRIDFDKPAFNSYSTRLLISPAKQLVLQVSAAYLKAPGVADENVTRTTASLQHHWPLAKTNRYLASSFIWGRNTTIHRENSFLAETCLQLDKWALYARYEFVQKDAEELDLRQYINGHVPLFNVQAFTAGANYVILRKCDLNAAVGSQASLYITPYALQSIYGTQPVCVEVYLRLYPQLMRMRNSGRSLQGTN